MPPLHGWLPFDRPLRRGRLVARYKRFFADVILDDGTAVTAHCANSGSMRSVCPPGAPVWLSPADTARRTLAWTWELVEINGALVGVNTNRPNALIARAIAAGGIAELAGYARLRREVRYGTGSRIDLLLDDGPTSGGPTSGGPTSGGPTGGGPVAPARRPPCFVEIKSVTLMEDPRPGGCAAFPDAVTTRGTRHLEDLARQARAGDRAVLVFVVQRTDAARVTLAATIDPAYARAFDAARADGVEVFCLGCAIDPDAGLGLNHRLPLVWAGSPP